MIAIGTVLLVSLVLQGAPPPVATSPSATADGLAAAKQLYTSGAYEDALLRLSGLIGANPADGVGQVRALCLLALGRTTEARQSLETIVQRDPLFRLSEADVSPQLIALFREARRNALPGAIRDLYARGRASFDARRYADAIVELRDVIRLLADEDLGGQAASFADFRTLAEGFISLSEQQVAAMHAAAAAEPAPRTATTVVIPPVVPRAGTPAGPRIYSNDDKDVLPPVDVTRPMPPWYPPTAADQAREHRGLLRIVIDERGYVENASLVTPVAETYDPSLLAATKYWKFRPAVKDGAAVKFMKLLEIVLAARERGGAPDRY